MEHSFNPIFAQRYGMVAAVFIHDFDFWIRHNRANKTNFHEGRYWTYNSAAAFTEMYPYMGKSQIYSALKKLVDDGIIIKGDFNTDKWKHRPWYSITDKGYEIIAECEVESEKLRNGRDSENQTVENQKTELSSCEKSNDDVQKINTTSFENHDNDVQKTCTSITDSIYIEHSTNNSETNSGETNSPSSHSSSQDNTTHGEECGDEQDINPYGYDNGQRLKQNTVYAYASQELKALSHRAMQELQSYVDDTSEEVVRHAIDNTLDQGIRTYSYVKKILDSYVDEGVKTVGEAKAYDDKRRKEKSMSNQHSQFCAQRTTPEEEEQKRKDKEFYDRVFASTML